MDKSNPSKIINVRTDYVRYLKQNGIIVDEAYLQKNWNMGKGWFLKMATGLFEEAYGGLAGEILYYPLNSPLALGIEGAVLKKRTYSGVGFTDKIRKLKNEDKIPKSENQEATYHKFLGSQYFLNLYYHFDSMNLDSHLKGGKFLANDWGVRSELSRYYLSGMQLTAWFTYTDSYDKVNEMRYFDHGIAISLPIDIFYTHTSKKRWDYGMSAWLRDVGASASTGKSLHYMIYQERFE